MRFKEGQEIKMIVLPGRGGEWEVGKFGTTKITMEAEPGQMAMVPWFAIWKDDKVVTKVNAAHVESVWPV